MSVATKEVKKDKEIIPDTPMMKQYCQIKADYTDAILFFRLGDFYEMFLGDAVIASKELDLVLTGRGKDENRVQMCGLPFHAADAYISKLVNKGYKVAICEQVEDANLAKGLTKREVIKVVTPGTVIGAGTIDDKENNYLLAVSGPLEKDKYGVAYIDITTGEFKLLTLQNESELLLQISRIAAKEVLVPVETELDLPKDLLANSYNPFDITRADEKLRSFFKLKSLSAFGVEMKSAAYPAAWAIIDYLQITQMTSLSQIAKLTPVHPEDHLFIDDVTCKNLELIQSIYNQDKNATLFWVLDKTKTAMGARRLKSLLKNPFLDSKLINKRLDAVENLVRDLLSREEIREVLKDVYDLERLISRIVSNHHNPKDCLALKQSLTQLLELPNILEHLSGQLLEEYNAFFKAYKEPKSKYSQVIDLLEKSIRDDAPINLREGGIIKEGYREELDQLLISFKSIRDWIAGLEEFERKRTGIKQLKVGFNKVFGYYFEISNSQKDKVPQDYIRKQTLSNAERYITPELKEKENILLNGEEKQIELEKVIYEEIVDEIRKVVKPLQKLAEIIADLDCLQSFATVSHKNNYTRPEFVCQDDLCLEIRAGRHPVLEKNSEINFIPNDITMSKDKDRFILITGPNMAGKSTLMRQIALIVVMAQSGCFVPVESARLSIIDKLFTRIGALDNLYVGQSTFMVEMLETAVILNSASKNSLIILDEIGRGTSTFDGICIAAAVSEYIHDKIGARTLFATHYHELTSLKEKLPAFGNYSMQISETDDGIVFQYKFSEGPADKSYGIHVADMAGMPKSIIKKAEKLLAGLEANSVDYLKDRPAINQLKLF